jgi:hypothetical protein
LNTKFTDSFLNWKYALPESVHLAIVCEFGNNKSRFGCVPGDYFYRKQRIHASFRQYVKTMRYGLLFLATCLSVFSCKKSMQDAGSFQNNAVITGLDMRDCPCVVNCPCICGGILFHFTDTTYTANIPIDNAAIFNLTTDTQYPVYVKVNWQNTTRCGVTAIKITGFRVF